jgi:hypothetical protein
MKKLLLLLAFSIGLTAIQAQNRVGELKHVVLFTFKPTSSPKEVENVAKTFAALYGKVPQVKKMEWGIDRKSVV